MAKPAHTVTLEIHAQPPVEDGVGEWKSRRYEFAGVSRDKATKAQPVKLQPGDVLEIELENGTRLLAAAQDAHQYLGQPASRGAAGPADTPRGTSATTTIVVGQTLRFAGPQPDAGAARDGIGAWALKSLQVFHTGPAGMTAFVAAGAFQDRQLGNRLGLHRLSPRAWSASPIGEMPPSGEPSLLFLHGTASSTEGSFRSLWEGGQVDARVQLERAYGERIYGFEHRSLTDSPISNVLALVQALPKGARLHLVSHSRGGMLGELLARANRVDSEPFTEQDIQRFLAHGKRTGRTGFDKDADNLRKLNQSMRSKGIRVERFVRVAATARGTTLASGRLDRWSSVMLNLLGRGIDLVPGAQPVGAGYAALKNFLLAVVKERTDARVLPGIEAMMPDSPLVALLNAPDVVVASPLHVIAGDFDGQGLLAWLGDCLSEAFYGGATDLVVNTASMSGGAARSLGIWCKPLSGPVVHHLNYFAREESVRPLLEALGGGNAGFDALAGPSSAWIARGGTHTKPLPDGPIALVLPGIMGSALARNGTIWMNPLQMIGGGMARLAIDAPNVTTDGWIDTYFEGFAQHLAQSHEVRPFVYDWRLSIADAAGKFGAVLDAAMTEAEARNKPLRIAAHSMGGLVARLALKRRWPRFKAIAGSRLVQFGTPNGGSHSIAAVLTGRDSFVQMIEKWLDWKHDMRQFLDIVREFPGVLELLPWPGADGKARDGVDYFDAATWAALQQGDDENASRQSRSSPATAPANGAGDGWQAPDARLLARALNSVRAILDSPLEPGHTAYVAGSGRTPVAMRAKDGQIEIGWTAQGDGRVPWESGVPQGVKTWYVDASHGDLLKHERAFDDYVKLLETGSCTLPTTGTADRSSGVTWAPALLARTTLYPTQDEVVAAALGGRMPSARTDDSGARAPASLQIFHGSMMAAETPVLIGSFANDSLRGSAEFLDKHLGYALSGAHALGRYPAQPGDAMVFPHGADARPGGAIVVGLGAVGELRPGELTRALTHGMVEFARTRSLQRVPAPSTGDGEAAIQRVQMSSLLVGTGFAGLSIDVGVRCIFDAIQRGNRVLEQAGLNVQIGIVCLFENEQSRAIAAAAAARDLCADRKYGASVLFDGHLRLAQGRFGGAGTGGSDASGWNRVHINDMPSGGLRFTMVSDRARNEVQEEPDQRQAVDGLIRAATQSTLDQPGLSRALYELMLPNGFKESLPDFGGLVIAVDPGAATYPWELMRDEAPGVDRPLATRVCLVRQLASTHGRTRVAVVSEPRALVVGDTQSGLADLPGARQEARMVGKQLGSLGLGVSLMEKPDGDKVIASLFDGRYRVVHLAAHGTVAVDGAGHTGMVLGHKTYLTAAQVGKLRHVPELVFINCCHLGSMAQDSQPRWGELAASLATQFIEMGCKAVIAAGWAVDDAAAATFAGTFYEAMIRGEKFGAAVLAARLETWLRHPGVNTWGAYQAYGNELFELQGNKFDEPVPNASHDYLHASQVVDALDRFRAGIGPATNEEQDRRAAQLQALELAVQPGFFHFAQVRECLGATWAALGDKGRAIPHYRAALSLTTGHGACTASLHAMEQLANLEIRHGAALRRQASMETPPKPPGPGNQLMDCGLSRITALIRLGNTVERSSILGSHWKLRSSWPRKTGDAAQVNTALKNMLQAYKDASDLSLVQGGERDYYPCLNLLETAIVQAARGDRRAFGRYTPVRAAWLEEALQNSKRRYAQDRNFFHAYSVVDAARVDALWAMLDDRGLPGLEDAQCRQRIVGAHGDLVARLGNAASHDSAISQLNWLISMLPPSGANRQMRQAVQSLLHEIRSASQ